MMPKTTKQIDLKLLDQTIKKVLAYQPAKKRKPRAAKKNSGAAARRGRN